MKRLEDSLKDHFDHFQPEVDPAVWQQLSQQIPGGSAVPAGKGFTWTFGGKAVWFAGGMAALLTAGIVLYKILISNDESIPTPSPAQQEVIQKSTDTNSDLQVPFRTPSTSEETTSEARKGEEPKNDPIATQKPSAVTDGQNQTNDKAAGQTALTGQTGPEKGGATTVPPPPVTNQSTISEKAQPAPPGTPSSTIKQSGKSDSFVQPVLILSAVRGFAPLAVTFMTNMEGQLADYDFGDGNSSHGKLSTTHRYEESGVFEAACTINGEVLRSTVTVSGRIPTAFSPNGDGVNDRFTIDNPDRILIDLRIFSRSGQLVFSGKGPDLYWDGRLPSGDLAPEGTYLVHILAPSFEGATHQQKGTIQLFR